MKSAILILTLLFSAVSIADQTYVKLGESANEYLVQYNSEGKWIVDRYIEPVGQLQDRVLQKVFNSEKEADEYTRQETTGFSEHTIRGMATTSAKPRNADVLWEATNAWTDEWDHRYAEWMDAEFSVDFFSRYNIATDCADAAYATRWIFARMHSLPAHGRLAGSGRLLTHESMRDRWRRLPTHRDWHQDQRFLAAIDYLMNNTYTHTLKRDTYATAINPKAFRVGTIYLTLTTSSGHTRLVSEIGPERDVTILSSDVPRRVRDLYPESFTYSSNVTEAQGGFVHFRWLQRYGDTWRVLQKREMPDYSTEQFEDSFTYEGEYFYHAVHRRLFGEDPANRDYNDARLLVGQVAADITKRIPVVKEGYEYCQRNDCSPGTAGYDNWSTPSRDSRTTDKALRLQDILNRTEDQRVLDLVADADRDRQFQVYPEVDLSWTHMLELFQAQSQSVDPRDNPLDRWGVGSTQYQSFQIRTESPYRLSTHKTWWLNANSLTNVRFRFSQFHLEEEYDYLIITAPNGEKSTYTGSLGSFTTEAFPGGGFFKFQFISDYMVQEAGFYLSEVLQE